MASETKEEYTVVVTGWGPFQGTPITPSMIAKIIPTSLPSDDKLNLLGKKITILGPKADYAAIPAEYGATREVIKHLHAKHGSQVDLWVHLAQWLNDYVGLNERAFRQDFSSVWNKFSPEKPYYESPDSIQQNINDLGPNPWADFPLGLNTEVPVDAAIRGANKALKGAGGDHLHVRPHHEAGGQGAGFGYYESLAHCVKSGRKRNVVCLCVPPKQEQVELEKARDAVLAFIGASLAALKGEQFKELE